MQDVKLTNKCIIVTDKGTNKIVDLDSQIISESIKQLVNVDKESIKVIQFPKLPKEHKLNQTVITLGILYKVEISDDLLYNSVGGTLDESKWMSLAYRTGKNKAENSREVFFRDDRLEDDQNAWRQAFKLYDQFKKDIATLRESTLHNKAYLWDANVISAYCQATTSKKKKDDSNNEDED